MNQTKKNRTSPSTAENRRTYYRTRTRKNNTFFELTTFPENISLKKPNKKIYPTSHLIDEGTWDNWVV